jgi:hypothetical protein
VTFGRKSQWSDSDDAALRQLVDEGFSRMRMSVRLKRTENAIKRRAMALGLKLRHRQPRLQRSGA